MKDKVGFNNTLKVKHFDKDGNLLDTKELSNTSQNNVLEDVIDMLDESTTKSYEATDMAIGTGTGQGVATSTLSSKSSEEAVSSTQSGSPEDTVTFTATFTAAGSWNIQEAGLFPSATCDANMLFYNDSISQSMSSGDTLQISWEVSIS